MCKFLVYRQRTHEIVNSTRSRAFTYYIHSINIFYCDRLHLPYRTLFTRGIFVTTERYFNFSSPTASFYS